MADEITNHARQQLRMFEERALFGRGAAERKLTATSALRQVAVVVQAVCGEVFGFCCFVEHTACIEKGPDICRRRSIDFDHGGVRRQRGPGNCSVHRGRVALPDEMHQVSHGCRL